MQKVQSKSLMTSTWCYICDANLTGQTQSESHYASKKHEKNYALYEEKFLVQLSAVKPKGTPKVSSISPLHSVTNGFQIPTTLVKPTKPTNVLSDMIKCHLCKSHILRSQKAEHINGFPHCLLLDIKHNLILEKDCSKEFWVLKNGESINCTICNVKMPNIEMAKSHLNGKPHASKYVEWLSQQPLLLLAQSTVTKWYYCQLCNVTLDGTSDAEKHYVGIPHNKKANQSQTSQTLRNPPPVNATPHCLEAHASDPITNKNSTSAARLVKVTRSQPKTNFFPVGLETFPSKSHMATDNGNVVKPPEHPLKDQLFNEVRKFVEAVYYSDKLPFEVSLKYLKKVNRDVEDIIRNYEKTEASGLVFKPSDSTLSACDKTCDITPAYSSSEDDKFVSAESKEEDFEPFENLIIQIPNPPRVTPIEEVNKFLTGDSKKSTLKSAGTDAIPLEEHSELSSDKPKTIDEMLFKVYSKKLELEQVYPNTYVNALEIELVTELEHLLAQVMHPKAPLKPILKYLEQCNAELDQKQSSIQISEGDGLRHDDEWWQ